MLTRLQGEDTAVCSCPWKTCTRWLGLDLCTVDVSPQNPTEPYSHGSGSEEPSAKFRCEPCCPNLSVWVWVLLIGWGMVTAYIFLMTEKLACIPQVERGAARWEGASPRLALCPIPDCQGGSVSPQVCCWLLRPLPGSHHQDIVILGEFCLGDVRLPHSRIVELQRLPWPLCPPSLTALCLCSL